jgi:hypothetical protein
VIAIDDSGDRKDGTRTAHVGRQWLGRYGKTDNGIVTVTTVWAAERVCYPLHAEPYTPASRFPQRHADPDFRTKLQIAAELMTKAHTAGVTCRAVVGDCFYGDHDDLRADLRQTGWSFVMSLKPSRGTWQYGAEAYTPRDAARAVPWGSPDDPGGWSRSSAGSATAHRNRVGDRRPPRLVGTRRTPRLIIANTDPQTLPDKATWYLATNLPRPGGSHDTAGSAHEPADPTEVVRLYGIRHWIEQSYNKSRTNSAGPTSKSVPPPRSDATKPWPTARSRSRSGVRVGKRLRGARSHRRDPAPLHRRIGRTRSVTDTITDRARTCCQPAGCHSGGTGLRRHRVCGMVSPRVGVRVSGVSWAWRGGP